MTAIRKGENNPAKDLTKNRPLSPIGEATANRQDAALIVVQALLRKQGIRARLEHTISLGLSAVHEGGAACTGGASSVVASASRPSFWLERFPPELVIFPNSQPLQAPFYSLVSKNSFFFTIPHISAIIQYLSFSD